MVKGKNWRRGGSYSIFKNLRELQHFVVCTRILNHRNNIIFLEMGSLISINLNWALTIRLFHMVRMRSAKQGSLNETYRGTRLSRSDMWVIFFRVLVMSMGSNLQLARRKAEYLNWIPSRPRLQLSENISLKAFSKCLSPFYKNLTKI